MAVAAIARRSEATPGSRARRRRGGGNGRSAVARVARERRSRRPSRAPRPGTGWPRGDGRCLQARWTTTRLAGGIGEVGGDESGARYRLVLYGKPDCTACSELKRKVQALIDRAKFVPSALSLAVLEEERDVNDDLKWVWKYGGSIPELTCLVGDGEEVLLPRVDHRDTTDAIGKHLERVLKDLDENHTARCV